MSEFFARFNRHSYVIIGIESVIGYERLDSLIGVDGVDGVFIGPHDLSVSLEAPEAWDNPEFHRIIRDIVVRCRRANVGVGVHLTPGIFSPERTRDLMAAGMNWILDGSDVGHAVVSFRNRREMLGVSPPATTAVSPEEGDGQAAPASCAAVQTKPPLVTIRRPVASAPAPA
jgi:4-hydroxy-2-oxoheptanedioate aldolase